MMAKIYLKQQYPGYLNLIKFKKADFYVEGFPNSFNVNALTLRRITQYETNSHDKL